MLRAFYEDVLGLNVVYHSEENWKWGESQVKFTICKLAAPGQEKTGPYLELVDGPWGAHVAFTVDEWPEDVALNQPEKLGGHTDGVEVKFCMDLAGNMVELVKEKK
jgi:catechol 2,3-dioxygenase-like lactoylglutathione lyase family enzyme